MLDGKTVSPARSETAFLVRTRPGWISNQATPSVLFSIRAKGALLMVSGQWSVINDQLLIVN